MPTYEVLASFWRDWRSLTPQQQLAFRQAVQQFTHDLGSGAFRPGLRIKRIQGYAGVWELSWAADGRATFEYGDEIRGDPHIVWRRIGTHDISVARNPAPVTRVLSVGPGGSCTRLVPAMWSRAHAVARYRVRNPFRQRGSLE
jgi:hypothetical protein